MPRLESDCSSSDSYSEYQESYDPDKSELDKSASNEGSDALDEPDSDGNSDVEHAPKRSKPGPQRNKDADDVNRLIEQSETNGTRLDLDGSEELDSADLLFDGNLNHPECYRQGIERLNEVDYDRKDYSAGTELMVGTAGRQWKAYVP